jgi:NAD(P)-dependent dehydrogenase (short-subunit alcohol dehydrogenase family)
VKLEGHVAVVDDGGSELGRAIALALSARGVSIVVCGPVEKPLAETVGHVVYAGGKARHVVGSVDDGASRAREVFGRVDMLLEAEQIAELVVKSFTG